MVVDRQSKRPFPRGERVAERVQAVALADEFPGVIDAAMHGILVHVLIEDEKIEPKVARLLKKNEIIVNRMEVVLPSLEDVFISMVEEERVKVLAEFEESKQ